jgi:hypothetical protein
VIGTIRQSSSPYIARRRSGSARSGRSASLTWFRSASTCCGALVEQPRSLVEIPPARFQQREQVDRRGGHAWSALLLRQAACLDQDYLGLRELGRAVENEQLAEPKPGVQGMRRLARGNRLPKLLPRSVEAAKMLGLKGLSFQIVGYCENLSLSMIWIAQHVCCELRSWRTPLSVSDHGEVTACAAKASEPAFQRFGVQIVDGTGIIQVLAYCDFNFGDDFFYGSFPNGWQLPEPRGLVTAACQCFPAVGAERYGIDGALVPQGRTDRLTRGSIP